LPHIEWAINTQIMRHFPTFLQVHASVLEVDGQGVIFPASPSSGKTTLAMGLLARGWRYLSDEFALIHPETLQLHPYPKALCIKEGSFRYAQELGLLRGRWKAYLKGSKGRVTFLNPHHVRPDAVAAPCPVRHVVFCRYAPGEQPLLEPIPRAEAVIRLNLNSFNFLKFRGRGLATFVDVVKRARCYELRSGPLAATCDLIESTILGRQSGAGNDGAADNGCRS
ncbi:MAG: hypothetical protein IID39_03755, partial [Planctomycetes bacterium]|nr:hypothetical protein [Planctomycetota bacterium]